MEMEDMPPEGGRVIEAVERFTGWHNLLIKNADGFPKALLANVISAGCLAPEWRGLLGFDEFAHTAMMMRRPPWIDGRGDWTSRPWADDDDVNATVWMQRNGIHIKCHEVASGIQSIAKQNSFHPVRDYLGGLAWDGESRIETLMSTIFGVRDSPYVQAVFRCFMISAVARAYDPGCKVDSVLILEGPQGVRKSTALRELFGEPFFTDDMPDLGTKDAAITVGSAWCIELAELSAMSKREIEAVKAFITRRVDNFRPPYGRRNVKIKRQSIMVGSTNSGAYLKDDTGGRRYWPLKCGYINIDLLRENRDQLWAEAVALYHLGANDGGAWWFTDQTVIDAAREQQEERYQGDPWESLVLEYVAAKLTVTAEEVMMAGLGVSKSDLKTADLMRVGGILTRAGWIKDRIRLPGRKNKTTVWTSPDELGTLQEAGHTSGHTS